MLWEQVDTSPCVQLCPWVPTALLRCSGGRCCSKGIHIGWGYARLLPPDGTGKVGGRGGASRAPFWPWAGERAGFVIQAKRGNHEDIYFETWSCAAWADLELAMLHRSWSWTLDPPASTSKVWGLTTFTTMPIWNSIHGTALICF